MSDPRRYLDRHLDRFRDELFEFLRIPSVSTRAEHEDDVRTAAGWLASRIRDAGLEAEVVETAGHPVVLGEWREAGPDAPTLLVYGHYDVQPPDPLEEWTSPPFEPTVRDGRIYARGAADDKGQVYAHVKALEAWLQGGGDPLPVNVVVLVEGEEEVGSPNLLPFVDDRAGRLTCDGIVISDSTMFAPGRPSLLVSLRGLAYFELRVSGPATDLHSGSYGGAVANPAGALARILASLRDEDGRIAIRGFYDDVAEPEEALREAVAALPFDDERYRRELGVPALAGEAGRSTLERLWTRPSCDVNGLLSGYTGQGAKTVLPARATGKVSFRLVPDQEPGRIAELFREHVRRHAPEGVEVEVVELHGGRPWRGDPGHPLTAAGLRALERAFGAPAVLTGEGGTIPIVPEFEERLGAPCLLMGFALPGANMHAPDEWLPAESFRRGIEAACLLYEEVASSARTSGS